jgi:hypothetical protein
LWRHGVQLEDGVAVRQNANDWSDACGKWAEDSHILSLPHARKVDPAYEEYHQAALNRPEMIGIYGMDPSPPPGIAPLTRAEMQAAIQAATLTLRDEMNAAMLTLRTEMQAAMLGLRAEIAIREAERLTAKVIDDRMRAVAAAAGIINDESAPSAPAAPAAPAAPEAIVEENDESAAAAEADAAAWT